MKPKSKSGGTRLVPRRHERPTVLVVDDEPFVVRMLRDKLVNAGIDVIGAVNGREALERVNAEKPDLIILDWMMPEMNGIETCETIRSDPGTAATPIIMLTAKGQEMDERRGKRAGATYYITKPFSPRRILRLVEECLAQCKNGRHENGN